MEYRVCRNNPAPYNDLNGKISLLGLGTMRLPLRTTPPTRPALTRKRHRRFLIMPMPTA